jgi:hypothetical protein
MIRQRRIFDIERNVPVVKMCVIENIMGAGDNTRGASRTFFRFKNFMEEMFPFRLFR